MVEEEWRQVVGHPGYDVSSLGRVRSWWSNAGKLRDEPRLMSASPNHEGYPYVRLKGKYALVHRLVLEAFVGPCPPGHVCRHFPDDNRANCSRDNIRWGTVSENWRDMLVHGTAPVGERHGSRTRPESIPRGANHHARLHPERMARGAKNGMNTHPERRPRCPGEKHGMHKLTESQVNDIRTFLAAGARQAELARRYDVSPAAISLIRVGKSWAHLLSSSDQAPVSHGGVAP